MLRFPIRRLLGINAAVFTAASLAAAAVFGPSSAQAQSIGSGSIRPFVTGLVPVIGPNGRAVGGVCVDVKGVLSLATKDDTARFRADSEKVLRATPTHLSKPHAMRKVSLKSVDQAIDRAKKDGKPIPQEILFLGGLTRVEYVIVDVDQKDVVLAGPAEPWRVGVGGEVVGTTSGQPIVRLQDLLVALRIAGDGGESATCSIDPDGKRLADLQRLLNGSRVRYNDALKRRIEQTLGEQQITFSGVAPTTRFAHVMLAADFQMKRLAMQLDPRAPAQPAGYLNMLRNAGRKPRNAAPRWWLAPDYDSLRRDPEGLVWKLEGQGVKALTENAMVGADGTVKTLGVEEKVAQRWAEAFSREFPELSRRYSAFADLRNCMDLSVVAALIWSENLMLKADCELPYLVEADDVQPPKYPAPQTVASRASLVRAGRGHIVAVSGGVELDGWAIVEKAQEDDALSATGARALRGRQKAWVWD